MKIYVDGELDIQATTSTPTVSDSQFLTIGVNVISNPPLNVVIGTELLNTISYIVTHAFLS